MQRTRLARFGRFGFSGRLGAFGLSAVLVAVPGGFGVPLASAQTVSVGFFDDSIEATEMLGEARRLREQREYGRAAELIDQVLALHADRLMAIETGRYGSVSQQVQAVLTQDAELLAAYRQRVEARAEVALAAAVRLVHRSDDRRGLDRVARRFGMTHAGVQAVMHRAALAVMDGDQDAAMVLLRRLEDHVLLTADADLRSRFAALTTRVQRDAANALEATATQTQNQQLTPGLLALAGTAPSWMVDPRNALAPRLSDPGSRSRLRTGNGIMPRVTLGGSGVAILSSSTNLVGFDVLTGVQRWRYQWNDPTGWTQDNAATELYGPPDGDRVSARGRFVYAVMGGQTFRRVRAVYNPSGLVRLDANTGALMWMRTPGEVDPMFADAAFVGAPLVGRDTDDPTATAAQGLNRLILVRLMRSENQQRSTWIAALRPEDGALVWTRLVVTVNSRTAGANNALAPIVFDDGVVRVTDGLGHTACFRAVDGAPLWLNSEITETERPMRSDWTRPGTWGNLPAPLRVAGGILAAHPARRQGFRILDPATGAVRSERRMSPVFSNVGLLVADRDERGQPNGNLLAMGPGTGEWMVFDGMTLEPQVPLVPDGPLTGAVNAGTPLTLSAVWHGDQLLVSDSTSCRVVERRGGIWRTVAAWNQARFAGVAAEAGVLVLYDTANGLRGYVDSRWATEQLLARAAAAPGDPEPALSLLRLAAQSGDRAGLEAGLNAALACAQGSTQGLAPDASINLRIFDGLLSLLQFDGMVNGAAGGIPSQADWVNRISTVANDLAVLPSQRARLRLAEATRYRRDAQPALAVAALQRILDDQAVAGQILSDDDGARQAGLEARRMLADLVREQGIAIYQPFDQAGARAFEALRSTGSDAERFVALADQYPVGATAIAALQTAGTMLAEEGQPNAAQAVRRRAYGLNPPPPIAETLIAELAATYTEMGDTERARAWLARAIRRFGDTTSLPLAEAPGGRLAVSDWLAQLDSQPRALGGSQLRRLISVHEVNGKLLRPRSVAEGGTSQGQWAADGFLIEPTANLGLEWREDTQPALSDWIYRLPVPIPGALPSTVSDLLAVDGDSVLLWSEESRRLTALDRRTGALLWAPVDMAALFNGRDAEAGTPSMAERERQWLMDFPGHELAL